VLTTGKKPEPWNNHVALLKALVLLAEKCEDSQIELELCAHLMGMKALLNLYLDSKLDCTWMDASLTVAKFKGH
jgi:hypothetical protein